MAKCERASELARYPLGSNTVCAPSVVHLVAPISSVSGVGSSALGSPCTGGDAYERRDLLAGQASGFDIALPPELARQPLGSNAAGMSSADHRTAPSITAGSARTSAIRSPCTGEVAFERRELLAGQAKQFEKRLPLALPRTSLGSDLVPASVDAQPLNAHYAGRSSSRVGELDTSESASAIRVLSSGLPSELAR